MKLSCFHRAGMLSCIFTGWICCFFAHADDASLHTTHISADESVWLLTPNSAWLRDDSFTIDSTAAMAPENTALYTPCDTPCLHIGIVDTSIWLRVRLKNDSNMRRVFYLELNNPQLNYVELFDFTEIGLFRQKSGNSIPFAEWALPETHPSFRMLMGPSEERDILLNVKHKGSMRFRLTLYDAAAFSSHRNHLAILQGISYGFLFFMFVHTIFLGIAMRDHAFLYQAFLIISYLLYATALQGTAFRYLWPNATVWSDSSIFVLWGICAAAVVGFSRSLLNTRALARTLDWILIVLSITCAILSLLSTLNYPWLNITAHLFGGLIPLLVFASASWCLWKGSRIAGVFLIAWSPMLIGGILLALVGPGLIPSNFISEYGIHIGSSIGLLLFTFVLSDRIRGMDEHYRLELERQVRLRTCELQSALENVKTLRGLIPICCCCKKVRDDKGYWSALDTYLQEHSDLDLTHGICPDCMRELYSKELEDT